MAFDSRIIFSTALLTILFIAGGEAIKCYQNQSRVNEPVQGTLIECSSIGNVRATGCLKATMFSTNTVTRMCDYTNCTENGIDRSKACYNTTDTSNCCCMSDGCNSAPGTPFFYPILFAIPSIFFGLYFTQ